MGCRRWNENAGLHYYVCVSQVLISVSSLATKVLTLILSFIYMQSFGSQVWDASVAIQALLAGNLNNELGSVLTKGHEFLKKSQVSVLKCYDSLFLLFYFISL